jgi:selenocysteine-specific elongation factor
MDRMPNIIVGTAGHIDHGKTALVRALTGIDADRLKEEKERGITIDLGFAYLPIDAETTLGFIDVPGHERFIKNMLAGVGGIDLVMLVVAADESVMPQTREHLAICSLLRIKTGLVALTKVDATDPELVDLAELEVREFLNGTCLEQAPIIRVSSRTGEGIPTLVETMRALARRIPPKDASRVFRLPIDRCFVMKGFGAVISGTLIAGGVRREDEVEILPAKLSARVRGVQVHGAAVDQAFAGQRTALNLQRVDLGDLERGMVVTAPGLFSPTRAFDVHLELLPSAPGPILRRKRVRFHVGTSELMGYVVLLGRDTLLPGESAFAQVLLEESTFALPGDRFIVRQYSPMTTIGGGEILDAHPRRHRRSDAAVLPRLALFKQAPLEQRLQALVHDADVQASELGVLVGRLGVTPTEARAALEMLAGDDRIRFISDNPTVVVDAGTFARVSAAMLEEVDRFHRENPLLKGIGREELRVRTLSTGSAVLFRAVLDASIAARKLSVDQDLVHLFARTIDLGREEQRIRGLLADRFRALGLQVPPMEDVLAGLDVEGVTARKILQLMVREHVLVKVSEDTAVDSEALQKLIADVRGLKSAGARFGVREFKDLTGLSRKFAVPLLEYLDGQRVTRRVGDERLIL